MVTECLSEFRLDGSCSCIAIDILSFGLDPLGTWKGQFEAMNRPLMPLRSDGLEIDEAGDGFIVYDPGRDRVHYLNHTAAVVLELSNGRLSVREIAAWVSQAYSLAQPPTGDIERLVDELVAEGLLQREHLSEESDPAGSRRFPMDSSRPRSSA